MNVAVPPSPRSSDLPPEPRPDQRLWPPLREPGRAARTGMLLSQIMAAFVRDWVLRF